MGARAIVDRLVEHAPTAAPGFCRWFDGSRVVDASGQPRVVYHGTDAEDFDVFDRTEDIGFHFGTPEQANARAVLGGESGRVIPVYLRIRRPLRMPDLHDWAPDAVASELVSLGVVTPGEADAAQLVDREQVRGWLAAKGYDGIVYANETEGGGGDSYVVFDSSQVKSAYATRFRPGSPRFGD